MATDSDRTRRALPDGVVTFLLTDVEASTRLWREAPEAAAVMARQEALIAAAVARHGGVLPVEQGEGDSSVAAFARASDALRAVVDAQGSLLREPWPQTAVPRVRMALHTGEAEWRTEGTYGGAAIIRCARLRALARGGQVLVSAATREVVGDMLPAGVTLLARETVQLDGFEQRERVYQLCHLDLPAGFGALRGVPAGGPGTWPTALVGRAHELADLIGLLLANQLVTVTGVGGAGKTRLAHAAATEVAGEFGDGVVWVELARLAADAQVAGHVAAACGVRETAGVPLLDGLARALAETRTLIVLDNCEHLLDGCAEVADQLLRAGPGVHVLATAREPLGTAGEITWRIPSLALPAVGECDPAVLARADAVALFITRARAALPSFELTPTTGPVVAAVCRRLDGLPLAIELAAARVRTLSLERVAAGLDDRFRLLTGGARTAIARQRTLLASVEWSHDLLGEAEQVLFRRLSVFATPFGIEAAEAVAAGDDELDPMDVFELLARLVDKSLVQRTDEHYGLLETLRHFALERAAAAGELPTLRDRHLAWFRRRATEWALDRELGTLPVLAIVAAEAPNLLAALEWSLATGGGGAVELLHPLAAHWGQRVVYGELRTVARRVLAELPEGSPAWLEALAPIAADAFFAMELDWMPAARRALDLDDPPIPAATRGRLEQALWLGPAFTGAPEGIAGLERAAECGRHAGNRAVEVTPLLSLTSTLAGQGDRARVAPLLSWLDRNVPADAHMRFLLDHAHASAATFDGDFDVALARLEGYLAARWCPVPIASQASLVALSTDDSSLALRAVAAAAPQALGIFAATLMWMRAVVPLLHGDLEAAAAILAEDPGSGMMGTAAVRVQLFAAELALARADHRCAGAALDVVEPRLAGTTFHHFAATAHELRAQLALAQGEVRAATARAHQALTLASDHGMKLLVVDALETLALVAGAVADDLLASRLLAATDAFRARTRYCHRSVHLRDALAALRPRLPSTLTPPLLVDAVELVRRGRGERRRPASGWDSLTPSEVRVVELIAAGLPNRDIATQLFTSIATVKTHLVHVYDKVGVRTRAELAVLATTQTERRPS